MNLNYVNYLDRFKLNPTKRQADNQEKLLI